jgi:hypothetical protein
MVMMRAPKTMLKYADVIFEKDHDQNGKSKVTL